MPSLNSSAISRVEYNNGHMQIWFTQTGGPYSFCGVPESIYSGLISAASAGGYYNSFIRDRYQC